jgi:hypothetical protein
MQQARGGILFIDEAHGLYTSTGNFYAREAVEALVGHITEKEFKGNLLVIMSGYAEEMDRMFINANPGLRSRFDKIRVVFPPWTGEQAAGAVVTAVEAEGKKLTMEAQSVLRQSFECMARLPSWASARDVYEKIIPAMYTKRASRLALKFLNHKSEHVASNNQSCTIQPLPYEVSDVVEAFQLSLGEDKTVLVLNSRIELKAAIDSAKTVKRLLVVYMSCEPDGCGLSTGVPHGFNDLNQEFLAFNVLFAKMNFQSSFDLIEVHHVMSGMQMPSGANFLCFYDGIEVQRLMGTNVLLLRQFIVAFLEKASRSSVKFTNYKYQQHNVVEFFSDRMQHKCLPFVKVKMYQYQRSHVPTTRLERGREKPEYV